MSVATRRALDKRRDYLHLAGHSREENEKTVVLRDLLPVED